MSLSIMIVGTLASLATLFMMAGIVRETRARLKAGPVRFRLPLASVGKPRQTPVASRIVLVICALIILPLAVKSGMDSIGWVLPILYLWILVNNQQMAVPRRDARRWLVLTSGLLGLATGASIASFGVRGLLTGHDLIGMPAWFFFFWSMTALVPGALAILELVSGTRVREGGVEMFGRTLPWSGVAVKGWREGEGGTMLCLTVPYPRPFGVPSGRDGEIVVPIPASDRPALEAFLTAHTRAAGRSRPGRDGCGSPELSPVPGEATR